MATDGRDSTWYEPRSIEFHAMADDTRLAECRPSFLYLSAAWAHLAHLQKLLDRNELALMSHHPRI
jgi:hypothetical protein